MSERKYPDWQFLRELYKNIQRPLALTKFGRDISSDILDGFSIPKSTLLLVRVDLDRLVQREIAGDAHMLATFILLLLREFPEADPYNH